MKILSKQNFNQNESKNFVVDNLSSAPSNPILGQVYYNTQDERAYVCIKAGDTPEWADLSLQEEVSIGEEEPEGRDVKIWINPEDIVSSNDYGSLPIGSIIPYSGETAPEGYSICDGKELNRETYKELFSIVGTTFGNGDGTSTFNLPNLKGRVTVGIDNSDTNFNTLGKVGGEKTHTLTINEMPSHTHKPSTSQYGQFTVHSTSTAYGTPDLAGGNQAYNAYVNETQPTGGGQAHNNLQPYITLNYIIKIYGEAMLTGDVIDSLEGDSSYNAPSIHAVNTKIKELEAYSSTAINEGSDITLDPNPNPNYNPINIQIDGKSEQITTKGNQLLDFSKYDARTSDTMTLTFEDGVLTTTCIASGTYRNFTWIITDLIKSNPGKTLSFTFDKYDKSQATDAGVNLQVYTGTETSYFSLVRADGTSIPYTIPEDVSDISTVNFRVLPNDSATAKAATLVITKPMLQFGTEKLDYEEYTGKQPSPNPDYPQEIKSVSGVENLFDKKNINSLKGYLYGNNEIAISENDTQNKMLYISCEPSTTYTISKGMISNIFRVGSSKTIPVASTTTITQVINKPAEKNITITTGTEDNYLIIYYFNTNTTTTATEEEIINSLMVEKSAMINDYVPFGTWLKIKDTGNNLFDKDNVNKLSAYVNTSEPYTIISNTSNRILFVKAQPNTNYIISKIKSATFNVASSVEMPDIGVVCTNFSNIVKVADNGKHYITLKTGNNDNYVIVRYFQSALDTTITEQEILDSIQIEKGTEPTEYEPYQSTSSLVDMNKYDSDGDITGYYELSSLGNIKDELNIDKDGNVSIKQNIGEIVLDGSDDESWVMPNNTTLPNMFQISTNINLSKYGSDGSNAKALSNYFINGNTQNVRTTDGFVLFTQSNVNYIRIVNTNISTVADFKTWLSTHPVTVQYELAEPQTINLGKITPLKLLEGTNNITTNDELQPNMKIEYYTDIMGNPGVIPDYDGLPVGSEIDFDGTEIPDGFVQVDDPSIYSSEEVVIGTWFGKKLYRKSFRFNELATGTNNIVHGIDNLDEIINTYGSCKRNDNKIQPVPRVDITELSWQIGITDVDIQSFRIDIGSRYSGTSKIKSGNITLEYTKTTD